MSESNKSAAYKLTLLPLVLLIVTTVFGFTNATRSFYLFGYNAIFWYIIVAITYFLPYAMSCSEFGAAYKDESGGLYTWVTHSMGQQFGFITIFVWYASIIIWMELIVATILIPISRVVEVVVFNGGADHFFHYVLSQSAILGIVGIALMLLITLAVTLGLRSVGRIGVIGGWATIGMNALLVVGSMTMLIGRGHLAEPLSWHAFFVERDPSVGPITLVGYITFSLFAFSGLEVSAGLVDKTKNPHKTFPRALLISAVAITIAYAFMIFCVGTFVNWKQDLNVDSMNLGNISYNTVGLLGQRLALLAHATPATSLVWNRIFQGLMALGVVAGIAGAFVVQTYSPVKQLIVGTPKGVWPKAFQKKKNDMPIVALWAQAAAVIILLSISSFGGSTGKAIINQLMKLSNVAMTVPCIFILIAYVKFRIDKNIEKPFLVFKSTGFSVFAAIVAISVLTFANLLAVLDPGITDHKWGLVATYAAGPVAFGLIGFILYRSRKKYILKESL